MIHNKKGLSEVVTTLIIILLVLVAIGIVWAVVSNILSSGAAQTEISAKCLQVDVKATAAKCGSGGNCTVTYTRTDSGDDIDGVLIVFSNGQNSSQKEISGNVAPLATKTITPEFETGITTPAIDKVEIAAYFIDASGNTQICATPSSFEF